MGGQRQSQSGSGGLLLLPQAHGKPDFTKVEAPLLAHFGTPTYDADSARASWVKTLDCLRSKLT